VHKGRILKLEQTLQEVGVQTGDTCVLVPGKPKKIMKIAPKANERDGSSTAPNPVTDSKRVVVLSTQFSDQGLFGLAAEITRLINLRPGWLCYNPNERDKEQCSPKNCRGSCPDNLVVSYDNGASTTIINVPGRWLTLCWRRSFKFHLEEAARTNGFMLQVLQQNFAGSSASGSFSQPTPNQVVESSLSELAGCRRAIYLADRLHVDQSYVDMLLDHNAGLEPFDHVLARLVKIGDKRSLIQMMQLCNEAFPANREQAGADVRVLDALTAKLQSVDDKLRSFASTVVRNLCQCHSTNQDRAFSHTSLVLALTAVVVDSRSLEVRRHAASALANVCDEHPDNRGLASTKPGVIPALVEMLAAGRGHPGKVEAAGALQSLCDDCEENRNLAGKHPRVFPGIAAMLGSGDAEEMGEAARVLQYLCMAHPLNQQRASAFPTVLTGLATVLESHEEKQRVDAMRALVYVFAGGDPNNKEQVLAHPRVLPGITAQLRNGGAEGRKLAAVFLLSFCTDHALNVQRVSGAPDVLAGLLALRRDGDEEGRRYASQMLLLASGRATSSGSP